MPKPPKPDRPPKHGRPKFGEQEAPKMVKLLVGEHEDPTSGRRGRFVAEWVEFEGRRVATFERGYVSYSVYKCTAYEHDAYRVYVSDESDSSSPRYALKPYSQGPDLRDYSEPFTLDELLSVYPMFAGELGKFRVRYVDPSPRP